jgi:hypothetical protein
MAGNCGNVGRSEINGWIKKGRETDEVQEDGHVTRLHCRSCHGVRRKRQRYQ